MITTPVTRLLKIDHPIVLAPMGGVAGGRLAAAVSNAGGLGLVGGGYGDADWVRTELAEVTQATNNPWGVGFITWSLHPKVLQQALQAGPAVLMLSFGDPRPFSDAIRAAGCRLVCQVQDLASATLALEAGADILVAQGTEGGGHGGQRASLPLIPAVVDLAGSVPVLAAGGIADGRGLAAALMLGASGALMGTRFYATQEALGHPAASQQIAEASGDNTQRTQVFDIIRGYQWPNGLTGRALLNRFQQQWQGAETSLSEQKATLAPQFWEAVAQGDFDTAMVWAGECIDLINAVEPAAQVVERIVDQARHTLEGAAALLAPKVG